VNRSYPWKGGEERLRTQGERLPVQVLILPALFDEANRMRRFTVQLMHALVGHGIGSLLPDLPGTGESPIDLADVRWSDWTDAIAVVADRLPDGERLSVAIRGGALLDRAVGGSAAVRAWQFSPDTGQRVIADMRRGLQVARRAVPGYPMTDAFAAALLAAAPGAADRVVRLASDPAAADRHVPGPPLWRRAEPGEDDDLVARIGRDIADWARR